VTSDEIVTALDALHAARFVAGRNPTGNDGVHVHAAFKVCKLLTFPVYAGDFIGEGLPLNAIAEAVRVG